MATTFLYLVTHPNNGDMSRYEALFVVQLCGRMTAHLIPTSPSAISRLLNSAPELNITNAQLRVRSVDNSTNIAVQGENEQQVTVAGTVLRHKGYVVRKTGRILYVYGKPASYVGMKGKVAPRKR